jgi:hypothetical protein
MLHRNMPTTPDLFLKGIAPSGRGAGGSGLIVIFLACSRSVRWYVDGRLIGVVGRHPDGGRSRPCRGRIEPDDEAALSN